MNSKYLGRGAVAVLGKVAPGGHGPREKKLQKILLFLHANFLRKKSPRHPDFNIGGPSVVSPVAPGSATGGSILKFGDDIEVEKNCRAGDKSSFEVSPPPVLRF